MHQMHSCCHSVGFRLSSNFVCFFFHEHLRSRFSNHRLFSLCFSSSGTTSRKPVMSLSVVLCSRRCGRMPLCCPCMRARSWARWRGWTKSHFDANQPMPFPTQPKAKVSLKKNLSKRLFVINKKHSGLLFLFCFVFLFLNIKLNRVNISSTRGVIEGRRANEVCRTQRRSRPSLTLSTNQP